jgi:hypothetical protein
MYVNLKGGSSMTKVNPNKPSDVFQKVSTAGKEPDAGQAFKEKEEVAADLEPKPKKKPGAGAEKLAEGLVGGLAREALSSIGESKAILARQTAETDKTRQAIGAKSPEKDATASSSGKKSLVAGTKANV